MLIKKSIDWRLMFNEWPPKNYVRHLFLLNYTIDDFKPTIVFIYRSSRKLLTPANILLVNLAFSDLLIILMIPIFIYNSFLQGPAIGGFGKI